MAVLLRPASLNGRFINDGRFIKAVGEASDRMAVLSTRSGEMSRSLDLEQDGNFYHFPCKEFINGRAVRIIEISRRKKRKPG